MQCTQMVRLHALSTRGKWVAQFNWMNGKTYQLMTVIVE